MGKNIVICFDGTWNDPTEETNVYQLFRALAAGPEDDFHDDAVGDYTRRTGPSLDAYYLEGVGANGKSEDMLAGATGAGLHLRVLHAFLLASRAYVKGDKFWIFGFSRGAWSARSLAGFMANAGLLPAADANAKTANSTAESLWMETKLKGTLDRATDFWSRNDAVPITLVAVWDTVGALGIPFFNGIKIVDEMEKHLCDFADLKLSPRVQFGRHALAIDERRKDFEPTLWNDRADGSIVQTWFAGVHSDVGGGYPERGLSDIAFKWMFDQVGRIPGAPALSLVELDPSPAPNALQDRHDETQNPVWKLRPSGPRSVPATAALDPSVIERFNGRKDYRPESLRSHPQVRDLFGAGPVNETVYPPKTSSLAKRLEVDGSAAIDAFAQNCWNALQVEVAPGEVYEFDVPAGAKWKDREYEAPATGYDSPTPLMKMMERFRRLPKAQWFCLVACVHPDLNLAQHNPDAGNMATGMLQNFTKGVSSKDSASQLVAVGDPTANRIVVDRKGYLYVFANDAPWAYSNNAGFLAVVVRRVK